MDFCNSCWTRYANGMLPGKPCPLPHCDGEIVSIDDSLSIAIPLLNEKGYLTISCCSGHVQEDYPQTYIQFMGEVSFSTLPKGFELEVFKIGEGRFITNVFRHYEAGLPVLKLQRQIWLACDVLLAWAEGLEPHDSWE